MTIRIEPAHAKRAASDRRRAFLEAHSNGTVLPIALEGQQEGHWCWAAIAAAVAGYYGAGSVTQNDVAANVLRDHRLDEWDRVAHLDEALATAGCFSHWSLGRPDFERIESELRAGRPIGVCLEWRGGGAHYVLVGGCFHDSQEICVQDPERGSSIQSYDAFPRSYGRGGARWQGTYWTTPPRAAFPDHSFPSTASNPQ